MADRIGTDAEHAPDEWDAIPLLSQWQRHPIDVPYVSDSQSYDPISDFERAQPALPTHLPAEMGKKIILEIPAQDMPLQEWGNENLTSRSDKGSNLFPAWNNHSFSASAWNGYDQETITPEIPRVPWPVTPPDVSHYFSSKPLSQLWQGDESVFPEQGHVTRTQDRIEPVFNPPSLSISKRSPSHENTVSLFAAAPSSQSESSADSFRASKRPRSEQQAEIGSALQVVGRKRPKAGPKHTCIKCIIDHKPASTSIF